ncbi:hypothetical protein AB0N73_00970 [Microbacterium sp. NPDC089189]|uniref:hypothetical protein n=1 Tax=Microbacterium sp. NPDC089189 TaxID=3154972 RepID=UPI00343DA826
MLIGLIRPKETTTAEVEGSSLADITEQLEPFRPEGWDLVQTTANLIKGTARFSSTGTFAARGPVHEIEADDRAALDAKIPDGWQLLNIRYV